MMFFEERKLMIRLQSDEYSLGLHLASNGFTDRNFNECYNVSIIDNALRASPRTLEVKENKFIQVLKTLRPLVV